jgi:hypothetical protein
MEKQQICPKIRNKHLKNKIYSKFNHKNKRKEKWIYQQAFETEARWIGEKNKIITLEGK